eukprot:EG_transcript_13199
MALWLLLTLCGAICSEPLSRGTLPFIGRPPKKAGRRPLSPVKAEQELLRDDGTVSNATAVPSESALLAVPEGPPAPHPPPPPPPTAAQPRPDNPANHTASPALLPAPRPSKPTETRPRPVPPAVGPSPRRWGKLPILDPEQVAVLDRALEGRPRDQPIIVAMSNGAFVDMTLNFLCSLRRLQLHNYLLFSDEEAHREFAKFNVTTVVISARSDIGVFSGRRFASLTRKKVQTVAQVVRRGFEVLFFDTDIVVLRDIWQWLLPAMRAADVIHDGAHRVGWIEGDARQGWDYAINYYVNHTNTAFYYMRSNPRTIRLMDHWVHCIDRVSRSKADDQDVLDGLVDLNLTRQRWNRLHTYGVIGNCRDLQLHLPRLLLESRTHFPSGGDYFVEGVPQRARITPFLVHNNQIHGSRAKVTRFQTAKLWLLDKSNRCRLQWKPP